MSSSPDHRKLLGAFLRAHRERLTAGALGLSGIRQERRRTPGLRREEVAQLCGMSPTWYTWIEQGRDISVSPAALSRLADALRLTAAERAYLFELARKRDPAEARRPVEPGAPEALLAAVATIGTPAYVLDPLWRACAWNRPAEELFVGWLGGPDPSLLRYLFLNPQARRLICDWEDRGRRLIAEFRADTAPGEDAEIEALVRELRRESAVFARFWDEYSVLDREGGERTFDHPERGFLRYRQLTLVLAGQPRYKLVMLLPLPGEGSAVLC